MFNLRALFQKNRAEQEMDDELRFHLEKQTEHNVARGMSAEEARYAAIRTFGNVGAVKEECRDSWGVRFINEFLQDLRYGVRQLRRNPGFTVVAVFTLALGIGANTAIFSVVNGVLLAPLPYNQPDRLVMIWQTEPNRQRIIPSYPDFKDWERSTLPFQEMAAFSVGGFDLTGPGEPRHVAGKLISPAFFRALEVKLAMGRPFTSQEDLPGAAPVAIISNRLWRDRFSGESSVLGKTITLNGIDRTIVGVVPAGFLFWVMSDVFLPLGQSHSTLYQSRAIHHVVSIARLKRGITLTQAQSEMNVIQQNLDQLYPYADRGLGIDVMQLKQSMVGDVTELLLLLMGAVGLVLMIACANVANLLLARSTARTHEFAIRAAVGAGRARIARQLITESVVLSLAGGAFGLMTASWAVQPLLAAVPGSLRRSENVSVNSSVLIFALIVSLVAGILFGLAPALKISSTDVGASLKEAGRGATWARHRAQNSLVIVQMALTLALLVGAGLLFRTIHRIWETEPGFDMQHLISFRVGLSPSITNTSPEIRDAYQQLLGRIREVPGVQAADLTGLVPLSQNENFGPFWVKSQKPLSIQDAPLAMYYWTGFDYLHVMGIPLLRGRYFSPQDTVNSAPVVVIDSTMAHKFFPGDDPVGKSLYIVHWGYARIIGVVGHVKQRLGEASGHIDNQIYGSFYQLPDQWMRQFAESSITLIVRTPLEPSAAMPPIRKVVYGVAGAQPVYDVQTVREMASQSIAWARFPMTLVAIFACLALVLASVGLYGVISYSVSQRTHEIGIRMALGAEKNDVLKMVVGQGLKLALIGVIIGIVGALALTRFLSSLLYGVKPTDPLTFVAVSLVLIAVALLACYIPARRAAKVDPMVALRYE